MAAHADTCRMLIGWSTLLTFLAFVLHLHLRLPIANCVKEEQKQKDDLHQILRRWTYPSTYSAHFGILQYIIGHAFGILWCVC